MDKEKIITKAGEIARNLDLNGFSFEEITALSLYGAIAESIGGIHMLESGNFPDEARLIEQITGSEPFQNVMSRVVRKSK